MKLNRVLLIFLVFNFGCSPSSNSSVAPQTPFVDEASYKALIDVKWCQNFQGQPVDFIISWFFTNDAYAVWQKSNIATKAVLQTQKVKWQMQNKTLVVRDQISNLVILEKDVQVEYDLNQARRMMKWFTPSTTNCTKGSPANCSIQAGDVMLLNECQ